MFPIFIGISVSSPSIISSGSLVRPNSQTTSTILTSSGNLGGKF